ncbi:phospho-sugar mutase [uncultured Clostridium sp.]|uniref:phospho-sugar mutase n=1 Tax=uncultured Clostridium sp. TaxID=59620 RepID=UPI002585ED4A|nr:phospho-sugar mutase [uncultured Clostridium sp.]MDU1348648.1 phospho-sugar mutase [Clostridium argentinense]
MRYKEKYDLWLNSDLVDEKTKFELKNIDENEIKDRFYKDLDFGTGGLRGIIGAGTNRLNIYTIGKVTEGLSNYLIKKYKENISVAIAYDSRHMSYEFAEFAARVFCGNNIKSYIFESLTSTPILSYAVRKLNCMAGVVITASHNPKEYNGYKVYNESGVQITDKAAEEILHEISLVKDFNDIKNISTDKALNKGLLNYIGEDIYSSYLKKVKSITLKEELIKNNSQELNIIYTPLHGTGNLPIRRLLSELGYKNVFVVKEQENPDGDFPTAPYPNPENPKVFNIALELAKDTNPDIILGTDPDCDRIGVMAKGSTGEYKLLTGNEVGVLLSHYILASLKEKKELPSNGAVIKTIVTTDMVKPICRDFGIEVLEVLTGFKYIGELIENLDEKKFIFAFEESYGYLCGDFVRDKDGIIGAMLICEMALYYKTKGISLFEALENLYEKYGYYKEELISLELSGIEGVKKINNIMNSFREDIFYIGKLNVKEIEDYKLGYSKNLYNNSIKNIILPKSNVIKFILDDDSWIVIRPSGTEPKIKFYISARGDSLECCEKNLDNFKKYIMNKLG